MSGQDEEYWRGKARGLLQRIAATEQRIEAKKDEIKKLGNGGFDITTGMKDNIAYIQDRNAQLQSWRSTKPICRSNWTNCKMRAAELARRLPGSVE